MSSRRATGFARPAWAAIAVLLPGLLQGCSTPRPEEVILLPGADGRTGALLVSRSNDEQVRLDQAYAQVTAPPGSQLKLGVSSAEAVQRRYSALLAIQPSRPRSFIVTFLSNSNTLTPETQPVLAQVREALAAEPAGELVVIGHTDGIGTDEANDRLSLERARSVRDLLMAMGIPGGQIQVEARGMREPLVPAPPQAEEPRNRRVEIKLR